jgi:alpha-tubulin suppressor-like RCC1 family protein
MMTRLAWICLALAPVAWACTIYDIEGMALLSPKQTIVIGDTVSMVVVDRDGVMPLRSAVSWSSSDSTVAVIDELGVVRGIGPGVALIGAVTGDYSLTIPMKVWEPARLVSVAAGGTHTCGLTAAGQALCWGSNTDYQMGNRWAQSKCEWPIGGLFPCAKSAIPIDSELRFTALAAGYKHVCGLTAEGSVHCWGLNGSGQLGDGTTTGRWEPAPVEGGHVFRTLEASGSGACGIAVDGRLLCWGESSSGILGDSDAHLTPTEVAPALRFDRVATSGDHVCGVATTGATWCWGSNSYGQLGIDDVEPACPPGGAVYPCTSDPVEVVDVPPLDRVVVEPLGTCGLTPGGEAFCWGRNDQGQLGDGTGMDGWQPRAVAGGHTFATLSAGAAQVCGVEAGSLWCWGFDAADFGNGGDPSTALEPVVAAGELALTDVSLDVNHGCAIAPDGVTWCWGWSGEGALGHGVTDNAIESKPLRVVLFDFDDTY